MTAYDWLLFRAVLAGLGVVLAAAPLGCVVVWRRMAYFGDATAHAGVLGIALALAMDGAIFPSVVVAALAMGIIVSTLAGRGIAEDTLLGVMAHGALAVGLVAISLVPGARIDLSALLLGDILAVSPTDLWVIWGGAAAVVALIAWRWTALLTSTLDEDLAAAAGIWARRETLTVTVALSITVAIAIQIVGVLLVAALMIMPAAAARPFASTPERMAFFAAAIGVAATLGGIWMSVLADTPTGPTIVSVALVLFVVSSLATLLRR